MGLPVHHTTFTIERDLPGSPRHAYRFWSEHQLKRQWNSCHPDWTVLEDAFDFRVGGAETMRWRTADGVEQVFAAHYLDIQPRERIIYAYAMQIGGEPLSSSLVTVEFSLADKGTLMTFTEQAAFRDAAVVAERQSGTAGGFDRLALVLERELATSH
ncbi:SRPBCC family protein [Devosia sp. ZB163]|uniref:SRPBCC family protein n=1 Tax=Devosia sp. ZB163 TaxID=3025938 RepID=UPI0023602CC6|nr:SRPBCC family protein [Devosia sp. ZB163]MDC9824430.1 SRPBCC family protein [Devosia sp. ZB163]